MATLDSPDANILDAEAINWRAIVYPIVALLILLVGGFFYYYYQQSHRIELEQQATEAVLKAKTPEELAKVSADFPGTNNGTIALLSAANMSFEKKDYDSAITYYKQAMDNSDVSLAGSARMGLASTQEAAGKLDDAIATFLTEAHLGKSSPYAPYAYSSAARLYGQKGDKDNELKTLSDLTGAGFDSSSSFVEQAQAQMKQLTAPPPTVIPAPVTASTPAPAVAPTPAPAAPVKK